jgi:hypothetical protein
MEKTEEMRTEYRSEVLGKGVRGKHHVAFQKGESHWTFFDGTRHLASLLPEDVSIIATDLNQPMLDLASELGTALPVEWRK